MTHSQAQQEALLRLVRAAVTIQRRLRGFFTRLKLRRLQQLQIDYEKAQLQEMLKSMQSCVKEIARPKPAMSPVSSNNPGEKLLDFSASDISIMEESVIVCPLLDRQYEQSAASKIQAQIKVWLNRKRFRKRLYRLILVKNLIQAKVHKEQMRMLFAFEQLIMNTEDPDDPDESANHSELTKIKQRIDDEQDKYLKSQLMDLYQQPMIQLGIVKPDKPENEFFENIEDIINEEDCEESVIHMSVKQDVVNVKDTTDDFRGTKQLLNVATRTETKPMVVPKPLKQTVIQNPIQAPKPAVSQQIVKPVQAPKPAVPEQIIKPVQAPKPMHQVKFKIDSRLELFNQNPQTKVQTKPNVERLSLLSKPKLLQKHDDFKLISNKPIQKAISHVTLNNPVQKQKTLQILPKPLLRNSKPVKTSTDFFKPQDKLDVDDKLPNIQRISKTQGSIRAVPIAKQEETPKQEERDWLLDPVNLYLRGMAQKRDLMKVLQPQISKEQHREITRRLTLQFQIL